MGVAASSYAFHPRQIRVEARRQNTLQEHRERQRSGIMEIV
jgi:hypothetical protein